MISGQGVIDHPAATRHPPVVYELHYEFQGWLVGDVVESFPPILVTRRLADAIEQERLTGADFDEAVGAHESSPDPITNFRQVVGG